LILFVIVMSKLPPFGVFPPTLPCSWAQRAKWSALALGNEGITHSVIILRRQCLTLTPYQLLEELLSSPVCAARIGVIWLTSLPVVFSPGLQKQTVNFIQLSQSRTGYLSWRWDDGSERVARSGAAPLSIHHLCFRNTHFSFLYFSTSSFQTLISAAVFLDARIAC
jgi:hypothetical protein